MSPRPLSSSRSPLPQRTPVASCPVWGKQGRRGRGRDAAGPVRGVPSLLIGRQLIIIMSGQELGSRTAAPGATSSQRPRKPRSPSASPLRGDTRAGRSLWGTLGAGGALAAPKAGQTDARSPDRRRVVGSGAGEEPSATSRPRGGQARTGAGAVQLQRSLLLIPRLAFAKHPGHFGARPRR